uniref:NIF3-like protein 1 n=1 Tax=Cuerna arida TaxID=1464854 RepID=A0A1B6FB83_9HEMI
MRWVCHLKQIGLCGPKWTSLMYGMTAVRAMSVEGTGVRLSRIVEFLTSFAPLSLAESWDNVGLLVEPASPVLIKKVLLTIDLTEDVMKEAVDSKTNLIIAYHPPIFQPFKRITSGKWKERLLATCLENKMAVYSPHTTWDAVTGGLSDWLASPFKFEGVEPLVPSLGVLTKPEFSHHVTVFCPLDLRNRCQEVIGRSHADVVSTAELETMVKYSLVAKKQFLLELESGLNETNCYYSIYERGPIPPRGCGTGRFGKLKSQITLSEAVEKVKALVGMSQIRLALQRGKTLDSPVRSVALVAGSGASVLRGVRADLYVTGEMLHHDILEANHSGASVILINHSDSERGYLSQFAPRLSDHFGDGIGVSIAASDRDPIVIV